MNRFDASMLWDAVAESTAEYVDDEDYGSDPSTSSSESSQENSLDHSEKTLSSWSASLDAQTFFVPMHYEANYRYPLIVWLHSEGFNENQVCQIMPHVSTRNYLATGIRATQAMDLAAHQFCWDLSAASIASAEQCVMEAIDRVATDYSVHAHRIVLAGYRDGGTMATQIALQNPDMFAAAISLGGHLGNRASHHWADHELNLDQLRQRRLPMLWQWSLESDRYDESKLVDDIQFAQESKSRLEVRQYCNEDEMNTVVLADLNQWIMNHVVAGVPVAKMETWDTSPTPFSDN